VNLVGIDHVGIGLDYVRDVKAIWDWIQRDRDLWPQAGEAEQPYPAHAQPEQIAGLVGIMLDHGYTAADIGKVLGGNFLRVMAAARDGRKN
jgi:membrane dipeptidase